MSACDVDDRKCLESETIMMPQTSYVNNIPITTFIPIESCTRYAEETE